MKLSPLYFFLIYNICALNTEAQVPVDPLIIPRTNLDSAGVADSLKNNTAVLISGDTTILPDAKPMSKADSIKSSKKSILAADSSLKHDPRKATFRSLVVPGWGQAYNKKYWKIPIVYGALGTTAAIFLYNLKTYKALKQTYIYLLDSDTANDALIETQFKQLSPESVRSYRTSYRQNVDYSVLFFLVFWGLNVVDATVDAHLKSFDVSSDISMKLKPTIGNATPGLSLVFTLNDQPSRKKLFLP
ncbi:MAG: DUF5683 domain-containing protein [Ginsengibacter sp.]